jgi:hypothetical protein
MDRALMLFVNIWVGIIVLAMLVVIIGQFYLHGFGGGVSFIQEAYSPFNIANYILLLIALSPAIGAYLWKAKRSKKRL